MDKTSLVGTVDSLNPNLVYGPALMQTAHLSEGTPLGYSIGQIVLILIRISNCYGCNTPLEHASGMRQCVVRPRGPIEQMLVGYLFPIQHRASVIQEPTSRLTTALNHPLMRSRKAYT